MNRKQSILATTVGTVTLAIVFTMMGGAAAHASPPGSTSSDPSTASCWVDSSTQRSLCVAAGDDLIAAVQDEDGVTIVVPAGTKVGGLTVSAAQSTRALLAPASVQTATVVSAIYDDINYGGGTLLLTGSSCSASISNLGTYGWNDRASSFKSFAGCDTALWQNNSFTGTHVGYTTNDPAFGSFNDQASSWRTT